MPPAPSSSKQAKQAADEAAAAAAAGPKTRGRRPIQYRGLFQKELPMMMYGFGDSREPDARSVEVMEALTINFLTDLCHRCRPAPPSFPTSRGYPYATRGKVKIDDLKFALRKDDKKLARLEELLYLEGIINGAKKILSTDVVDDVARQVEAEDRGGGGGGGGGNEEKEGEGGGGQNQQQNERGGMDVDGRA